MAEREPIFNVPAPVVGLLVAFAGLHAVREALSAADVDRLLLSLAFIPARYIDADIDIPGGTLAAATSFVTHAFVHADLMHLLINSAWLLAFGSILARRLGAVRFLAFFAAGSAAGAAAYLALHWGEAVPVVGASGAIAAMMGAVMRFLFVAIDRREGYLLRENPAAIPRMSVAEALTDRRIIATSLIFIAINLLALIGFGTFGVEAGIAWEAHVGGYAFGLLAFSLFDVAPQNASPVSEVGE